MIRIARAMAVAGIACTLLAGAVIGGGVSASADGVNVFTTQATDAGLTLYQARELQSKIDKELGQIKVGGTQVSANQIRTNDGRMLITIPLPGERYARPITSTKRQVSPLASCSYRYLCLYDGTDYTGTLRNLYYCSFVNLGDYGQNDRLGSFINNQTSGTVALFYNWEEYWARKFSSTAYQARSLLGSPYNNYIDGVDPC